MPLNEEKINLAIAIDENVKKIISSGGGDEELLASMHDKMNMFKRLLDTCNSQEMDILCQRYSGFYRFAKLLENLAQGISDGTIPVP